MHWSTQQKRVAAALLLVPILLMNCNVWTAMPELPQATRIPATVSPPPAITVIPPKTPTPEPSPVATAVEPAEAAAVAAEAAPALAQPAGCLSASEQASLGNEQEMLKYADRLLRLDKPLIERKLPDSWNAYTQHFDRTGSGVISLAVQNVENQFMVQEMMNALHVAGFVTWLRNSSHQQLQILAIPLRDPAILQSEWSPYIQAYWTGLSTTPNLDATVLPALKLPPCAWMVAQEFATPADSAAWAMDGSGWPDYARPASQYLASDSQSAVEVARRINWLDTGGSEGADTMCGPLAWSILNDAGAFPPGWGGWSGDPNSFWLAKPSDNGRPWSLFSKDISHVYVFHEPLGTFDFQNFHLYPGDFLYTYSHGDGFDHMLVITDVDQEGNAYTVTNIIHMVPKKTITIERVLLLNFNDPTVGIARNQWAKDKINGRTGHAGFEVFRWNWMEKDITGQPMKYIVQPGDTLPAIAALWKTPLSRIAEYNDIRIDSALSIGQELSIPPNAPVRR